MISGEAMIEMGSCMNIACDISVFKSKLFTFQANSIWSQSHLSQLAFDILKENYRLLSRRQSRHLHHLVLFVRQNFKWKFMRYFSSKLTVKFAS